VRRQHPVGNFLKPRRIRVIGVLVENRRDAHPPRAQAAERRGAVPVHMDDVRFLLAQHLQQFRIGPRVELLPAQVGYVDTELLQRILGQIFPAQADQRHLEAAAVEARNHPCEKAFDAVHARSLPAEVIADVHDVQLLHRRHSAREHAAR
jgi:hypothetical protein